MLRLLSTALLGTSVACGAMCQAPAAAGQSPAKPSSGETGERQEAVVVLERYLGYWNMGPTYMLLVYADGRVAFIGKQNVKTKGLAEGRIARGEVERLLAEARRINVHSLRDRYAAGEGCPVFMEDAGSVYISVLVDGKRKSIDHHLGCSPEQIPKDSKSPSIFPPELFELEELVDRVVNSRRWIE